ncbi:hypothetical protein BC831DRAFT_508182 [Entophlyctis helioformis]|nr:hypothetical protein BC831DRAFT_508182 [Entophlyctis helioformis]
MTVSPRSSGSDTSSPPSTPSRKTLGLPLASCFSPTGDDGPQAPRPPDADNDKQASLNYHSPSRHFENHRDRLLALFRESIGRLNASVAPTSDSISTIEDLARFSSDFARSFTDLRSSIGNAIATSNNQAVIDLKETSTQAKAIKPPKIGDAFSKLKETLADVDDKKDTIIAEFTKFLAVVDAEASDVDLSPISQAITISRNVVDMSAAFKAEKQSDETADRMSPEAAKSREATKSRVKTATRFLAKNGLEVASTMVSIAKTATNLVPIPGLPLVLETIENILNHFKDVKWFRSELKSIMDHLEELNQILKPMADQWFSVEVHNRINELQLLLDDIKINIRVTKRATHRFLSIIRSTKDELGDKYEEYKARLCTIKEMLSLAIQVDSAVMLLHTAHKVNLIDTKTDKILGLIRPRILNLRHDDFLISAVPEDSKGTFTVYKAKMDGMDFVLKTFEQPFNSDAIEAEARKWFNMSHPNILDLTGICLEGKDNRKPFLAFPFVRDDLKSFMKAPLCLPMKDRISILIRLARGIQYLHKYAPGAPIVHGSLTLSHVRVDGLIEWHAMTEAKMNDAGTLKIRSVKIVPNIKSAGTAMQVMDSPFLAPEAQKDAKNPQKPLDIYAFGIIAMAVLSCELPEQLDLEAMGKPEGVSVRLWHIINKCINHGVGARPEADELMQELLKVAPSKPGKPEMEAGNKAMLQAGATDLETLCFLFPEWTDDSEITTNSTNVNGGMLHLFDAHLGRTISNLRLEWSSKFNLTALRLTGCGLTGTIPKEIGNLSMLTELWLDQNDLDGISQMICKLTKLKSLRLGQNRSIGSLPVTIRLLRDLEELDIQGNQIGELPEALWDLHKLTKLNVSENAIKKIPEEIGQLTNLEVFCCKGLENNMLETLPESIGKLTNLTELDLRSNKLETLPESIGNLRNLTELYLSDNQLTELPDSIGKLICLTHLMWLLTWSGCYRDLCSNEFKVWPESFGKLASLNELDLQNNELTELPESIDNLTGLTRLNINSNLLTKLPISIGKLANLRHLYLESNGLEKLPRSIGNLSHLTELNLQNNKLAGLPESISNLTKLTKLYGWMWLLTWSGCCRDLQDNQLKKLPRSVGNLSHLTELNLRNSRLKKLPKSIGRLTGLNELILENNKLTGLPKSIGKLARLTHLDLQDNQLRILPKSIGNLTGLTRLSLNGNKLAGLPDSIGNLTGLTHLGLYQNELEELPESIGKLTGLTWLILRNNKLTGLPKSIGSLSSLTWLNLEENLLTGKQEVLGTVTSLIWLDLGYNKLTEMPKSIDNLTELKWLVLQNNKLTELPESIGNLTGLTRLNINSNKLSKLPKSISDLTALNEFTHHDNPFTESPEPIDKPADQMNQDLYGNDEADMFGMADDLFDEETL